MFDYCKTCPDQDTETCALPAPSERLMLRTKLVGSMGVAVFIKAGNNLQGLPCPDDALGMTTLARQAMDVAFIASEACSVAHQILEGDNDPLA